MLKLLESDEVINELKGGVYPIKCDRRYVHLTYYQCNESKAQLIVVVGKGLKNKVIPVVEFNLEEDNIRDYLKEAQKLKGKIKRYFDSRIITSDFRW